MDAKVMKDFVSNNFLAGTIHKYTYSVGDTYTITENFTPKVMIIITRQYTDPTFFLLFRGDTSTLQWSGIEIVTNIVWNTNSVTFTVNATADHPVYCRLIG